eukprot:GAFH01004613.1.p1 GENE.GAFH01004613.1~~GAFH01004613.1.p1  ORF type:complete len:147 (-),score=4.05 GAFH01004613.1:12-452(-)
MVYECDRHGGAVRMAGETRPRDPEMIMASNHYFKYKIDDSVSPAICNNVQIGFDSLWRYQAGRSKLEAWSHLQMTSPSQLGPLGPEDVKVLLQTVCSGATEHSVIWRPQEMVFEVANAQIDGAQSWVWDAPYRPWASFKFDEVFVQ